MLIIFTIINGRNEKFLIKSKLIDRIEKYPIYNLHLYKNVIITLKTFLWSKFRAIYWITHFLPKVLLTEYTLFSKSIAAN